MKQQKEDWINKRWRPAMGWMYMTVCIFDFILFPVLFTAVQFWEQEAANDAFRQWEPLTLQGAGLFHMAMGAVLGITAWSRGQEKIQGVAGGMPQMPSNSPMMAMGYNAPVMQTSSATFRESYTDTVTPITSGYKGKKAPVQPDYPEI